MNEWIWSDLPTQAGGADDVLDLVGVRIVEWKGWSADPSPIRVRGLGTETVHHRQNLRKRDFDVIDWLIYSFNDQLITFCSNEEERPLVRPLAPLTYSLVSLLLFHLRPPLLLFVCLLAQSFTLSLSNTCNTIIVTIFHWNECKLSMKMSQFACDVSASGCSEPWCILVTIM